MSQKQSLQPAVFSLQSPVSSLQSVIITGACGFIGRHLLPLLSGTELPIIAVDREMARDSLPDNIRFHRSDLSDPANLIPSDLDLSDAFCLIHLAWDMRRGTDFGPQAEQVRLLAGLLDYWTGKGLQRFVGLGSAEEYGRRSGLIHEYDPPIEPLSPYGWAKRSAGMLARSWGERHRLPVVWLRPFIAYGPGQQGDMMLPYAIAKAKTREVATFSDGLQERDFVHVQDLARAIMAAIARPASGVHTINIGTGIPTPIRDVLMEVAKQTGTESLFQIGARPRRPGESERQVADIGIARDVLGWQAEVEWGDGVGRMMRCSPCAGPLL
jgi:nucleoside-diphosphate-sugar epimerase